tara:strand:+ start:306 stop:878 length:573 start_codon:yes stop_codon:yes gene_type:complete
MSINNTIQSQTMAGGEHERRSRRGITAESVFNQCCENNNIYREASTTTQDMRFHWDGLVNIDGTLRPYDVKDAKGAYEQDRLFLIELKNVNGDTGWCSLDPMGPYWIAFYLNDRNAFLLVKSIDLYECVYNSIVSHTTDNKEEAKRLKCGYTRINYGRDDLMGYTDEETIKNNCLHKYYHIDPENPRFEM